MKKKIISTFLAGVMALSLIGCGSSSGKEESTAEAGGNKVTVKMVMRNTWDQRLRLMTCQICSF